MTPAQDLIALAARVEKAEGPDWELFLDAWRACRPRTSFATGRDSDNARNHFRRLCDVGAWIDAAMTLVPTQYGWQIKQYSEDFDECEAYTWAPGGDGSVILTEAKTPALALVAAAIRARAAA